MSDTDITPQEGMNPESEVIEDTTVDETVETHAEDSDETVEDSIPKSQFNQVLARAKKAEYELKAFKSKPVAKVTSNAVSEVDIDSRVLKAQGMSDDLLSELKVIAQLRGKTMIECQTDPLFIALKANVEEEAKRVKLPASRGSSSVKKTKDFNTPGLSEAEFKELWKAHNSR